MQALLRPILCDDALTRHLGDAEARILVEWLVERAEALAHNVDAEIRVQALCRRARAISLFVSLWCHRGQPGAAGQLANAERFDWPLTEPEIEADILMEHILSYEGASSAAA